MGRFATLNADTQDLVHCLLPALAASFKISDPLDIIPEDIRMRIWDCERRDHVKDKTENDPRNWGVQFLKDLMSISRLKGGDLAGFQADLRAKVALHEEKHPWCRLGDIKELKDEYENPGRKNAIPVESESESSSTDSYFEELVEPDEPKGKKRGRRNHEIYEARVVEKRHKAKPNRLRRAEEGGFIRPEKQHKKRRIDDRASGTPSSARLAIRRPARTVPSDREDSADSFEDRSLPQHPVPAFSISPDPSHSRGFSVGEVDNNKEPLAVQKLQAELEVAEAELKAARLKFHYIQAKEQAEQEAFYGGDGDQKASPSFD